MTKPLLTPAEKEWLKAVIKPYRKWITGIVKKDKISIIPTREIIIFVNNYAVPDIKLPINCYSNTYQFKGLELNTAYDLKTLRL